MPIFGSEQKGSATVEFAIVMPLMLLLLLGVIEFGHAFHQYNILHKTVRDGARFVAEEACTGSTNVVYLPSELIAATKAVVVFGPVGSGDPVLPGFAIGQVTVSEVDLHHVSVSAAYPYQSLLGFGASLPTFGLGEGPLSLEFTFHATVVMAGL